MQPPFDAYKGNEPYVFVSYAHVDKESVYPEIQRLHDLGYRIWYDEGIAPAHEWSEEIARAITGSNLFVVFMTPRAVESFYVRSEITFALNKTKPFLAVYLEETLLPGGLELLMGSVHAIMKYDMSHVRYLSKIQEVIPEQVIGVIVDPTPPHLSLSLSWKSPLMWIRGLIITSPIWS